MRMNCIKCKKEIPEDAIFCPYCGRKQQGQQRRYRKRANGTGTVTKLEGNRKKPWMARRGNILIGTYATRAAAEKALDRLTDIPVTDRFNLTFREIYELWLPVHSRMIGASGKGSYKTAYSNCAELHDKVFRKIRHSDFQNVIIRLEEEGKSKSSCEKVMQLFGQLCEWAIQEEIMQVNRARGCTIAAEQKSEGKVIPAAAIKKMELSSSPAAKIVLILIATGCRPNELFNAKRCNCHDNYFIGGSKTDAGRNRVIPVDEIGLGAYRELLRASEGEELLIDGYGGNRTHANFAKREWKALMEEIGLTGYTPYDCRHTYITNAKRAGVDAQILRRIVGHADLSTTDKYYTHTDKNDILSAVAGTSIYDGIRNKKETGQGEGK